MVLPRCSLPRPHTSQAGLLTPFLPPDAQEGNRDRPGKCRGLRAICLPDRPQHRAAAAQQGTKGCSPKMGLIVRGQNRGTEPGRRDPVGGQHPGSLAVRRGACQGVGRRARLAQGSPRCSRSTLALPGGCLDFSSGHLRHTGPGAWPCRGGPRQPGARPHPSQHGAAGCISPGKHRREGLVGFVTPGKARIRLSVRSAQLVPSTHLAGCGSRRLHATHAPSCPLPGGQGHPHRLSLSFPISGGPLGGQKRRATQSLPSLLVLALAWPGEAEGPRPRAPLFSSLPPAGIAIHSQWVSGRTGQGASGEAELSQPCPTQTQWPPRQQEGPASPAHTEWDRPPWAPAAEWAGGRVGGRTGEGGASAWLPQHRLRELPAGRGSWPGGPRGCQAPPLPTAVSGSRLPTRPQDSYFTEEIKTTWREPPPAPPLAPALPPSPAGPLRCPPAAWPPPRSHAAPMPLPLCWPPGVPPVEDPPTPSVLLGCSPPALPDTAGQDRVTGHHPHGGPARVLPCPTRPSIFSGGSRPRAILSGSQKERAGQCLRDGRL